MKFVAPLPIRKLRAEMVLKALRLTAVAKAAGLKVPRASEVMSGKRNDPEALAKLTRVIKAAKTPTEVAA